MVRRMRVTVAVFVGLALLLASGAAWGQPRVFDYHYPVPIPFYAGGLDLASLGLEYGVDIADVAFILPMYFYRPIDDLTPRPGAQALAMGGAYTALAEGPLALGWNPAALGRMREPALAVDGLLRSSASQVEELPDTVMIEGQPDFNIQRYDVRLGGTNDFGFAGGALPVGWLAERPIVVGVGYRRHTDVAHGEQTILEMGLFGATGYPFVLGLDNQERGAIESFTVGLGYEALSVGDLWLSVGATANFLSGRLNSDVLTRVSVRGFVEGHLNYRMHYKGYTTELGVQTGYADKLRLGGWIGLPHSIYIYDGHFVSTPIIPPNVEFVIRTHGEMAEYDLEVPLFASGGVALGPIRGIELAADVNYRPWSDAEMKHRLIDYSFFDTAYPGADVISYHIGGRGEFPLFRERLHAVGLRLMALGGYRTLPLSQYDLDIFSGEAPYYFGKQIQGSAVTFGLSLETRAQLAFHVGIEMQSYKFRKWFLDDTLPNDERDISFSNPWDRAPIVDRSVTLVRFGTEMRF